MSARTADLPMAFTAWEFVRGALLTYALFLGFTVLAWIWLTPFASVYAVFVAAPYALGALVLVGAPLALLTGHLLRRTADVVTHVRWHALVAAVAGCSGVFLFLCVTFPGFADVDPPIHAPQFGYLEQFGWIALAEIVITVVAAICGWMITARRALGSAYPIHRSPDELAEDDATARAELERIGQRR